MIETRYNLTIEVNNLTEDTWQKLTDFLEDNNFKYNETSVEEIIVDTRGEQQKYDDWLAEQADIINDERKMTED